MAARNHFMVHKSAVYAPITRILVSVPMFLRSRDAIKHISDISSYVFPPKIESGRQKQVFVEKWAVNPPIITILSVGISFEVDQCVKQHIRYLPVHVPPKISKGKHVFCP